MKRVHSTQFGELTVGTAWMRKLEKEVQTADRPRDSRKPIITVKISSRELFVKMSLTLWLMLLQVTSWCYFHHCPWALDAMAIITGINSKLAGLLCRSHSRVKVPGRSVQLALCLGACVWAFRIKLSRNLAFQLTKTTEVLSSPKMNEQKGKCPIYS